MRSLMNAKTNSVVNDRQDRTNVAGILKLRVKGLLRGLRADAIRALVSFLYLPGHESASRPAYQGAVRAIESALATAMGSHPSWRPEQPRWLLAFACRT